MQIKNERARPGRFPDVGRLYEQSFSLWKVDRVTDLLSLSYVVIIRIALEIVE